MLNEIVSIGDKIQLKRMKTTAAQGNRENVYTSQLLDITGESKALIAMPIEQGRVTPLTVGEKYQLWFYTSKGLYQCNAVIENRFKSNNIYVLAIEFTSELEKIQRRQFYRLDCLVEVTYRIISDEEYYAREELRKKDIADQVRLKHLQRIEAIEEESSYLEGIIVDLSGGGARMTSTNSHEKGETILIKANLAAQNTIKKLEIVGKLVQVSKMENRTGIFDNRIFFRNISNDQREMIIRYIFEEERKQRKREKGLN